MASIYQDNRRHLIENLNPYSLVILYAGEAPLKSGSEYFPFCVNKNFYYMTGINLAGAILVLIRINNNLEEHLFIRKDDFKKVKFEGTSLNLNQVKEISGAKEVHYLEAFPEIINSIFRYPITLYLDLERHSFLDPDTVAQSFAKEMEKKYPSLKINNVYNHIAKQRMVKNTYEIEQIKQACAITAKAFKQLLKDIKPGISEKLLAHKFGYLAFEAGADDLAFKPIIAAGSNGLVLHGSSRDHNLALNEVLIVDIGVEVKNYKCDIARTILVDNNTNHFNHQLIIAIIEVQETIIKALKPGLTFHDLNLLAAKLLANKLIELKVINEVSEIENIFIHSIGHHLGLDTHDASVINEPIKENAIITIEPGIYLKNHNLGIRIEDTVLITATGCEVLSKEIPKSIIEINKLRENG
jgi:Xaa-Pro aminopeptidase